MLVVGRIISGISVGLSSAVVPIYQSEITAPAIRGRMVSLQQWQVTHKIKTGFLIYWINSGLSHGEFWSSTLFNSVVRTSTASLPLGFLGVFKWFLLSSSVLGWPSSLKVRVSCLIVDSEFFNRSFRTGIDFVLYSEGEALQVLADLHGGGDKKNELVVLEYEQIRQQVRLLNHISSNNLSHSLLGS